MLGECRPMSAKITERQCGINQERGLYLCGKCDGLVRLIEVDIEEDLVSKRGTCVKCKRPDLMIVGQGLCGKCYTDRKKESKSAIVQPEMSPPENTDNAVAVPVRVPDEPAIAPDKTPRTLMSMITPPPDVKTEGIFLDFTDQPNLLADLQAISDDVPGDILELCSMLVSGKLRLVA